MRKETEQRLNEVVAMATGLSRIKKHIDRKEFEIIFNKACDLEKNTHWHLGQKEYKEVMCENSFVDEATGECAVFRLTANARANMTQYFAYLLCFECKLKLNETRIIINELR